jgi:hypothetical protein
MRALPIPLWGRWRRTTYQYPDHGGYLCRALRTARGIKGTSRAAHHPWVTHITNVVYPATQALIFEPGVILGVRGHTGKNQSVAARVVSHGNPLEPGTRSTSLYELTGEPGPGPGDRPCACSCLAVLSRKRSAISATNSRVRVGREVASERCSLACPRLPARDSALLVPHTCYPRTHRCTVRARPGAARKGGGGSFACRHGLPCRISLATGLCGCRERRPRWPRPHTAAQCQPGTGPPRRSVGFVNHMRAPTLMRCA